MGESVKPSVPPAGRESGAIGLDDETGVRQILQESIVGLLTSRGRDGGRPAVSGRVPLPLPARA